MKLPTFAAAVALAIASVSAPAIAQDAAIAVGAKVFGPDGSEVGTVESVQGDNVVVNTGSVTAALPSEVFGAGENGPTIGWNKAQLEAAVNEAEAEKESQLAAALVAGADLYSADAKLLGKVESVADESFVVTLASGAFTLPKEQVTIQADKLTFLATAADLEAAVAAQGGD
jgi:hypothetical protein